MWTENRGQRSAAENYYRPPLKKLGVSHNFFAGHRGTFKYLIQYGLAGGYQTQNLNCQRVL